MGVILRSLPIVNLWFGKLSMKKRFPVMKLASWVGKRAGLYKLILLKQDLGSGETPC